MCKHTVPRVAHKWSLVATAAALCLAEHATAQTTGRTTGAGMEEQAIELSPFEVTSSDQDVGYYASSTLAGTRMNSQLKDLASPISIVTAQQLEDTASVDLNDVFLYEAGMEGSHTYTAISTDRFGNTFDTIQDSPTSNNRARGIGSVDRARNYFVGINEIPIDSYNVGSLTIQRGPNSVLYGLGSLSGLVNSTPLVGDISNNSGKLEFRYGSWDDFRTSLYLNRVLVQDKLAIRVAALYHDKGIRQQPAFDKTNRYYAAVTYKPFENTTIRANFEHYKNRAQRAASVTPADMVSEWAAAGSPFWNPLALTATYTDGTTVTDGVNNDGNWIRNPAMRAKFPGLRPDESAGSTMNLVDNGTIFLRIQDRLGNRGNQTLPGGNAVGYWIGLIRPNQPERNFSSESIYDRSLEYPGYITPSVSDPTLLD